MKILTKERACDMGYSGDKRKRRRQHRRSAQRLRDGGGVTFGAVAMWHLYQARWVGR